MNNHTVEEINEFLPQASTIMNLLSYRDDYGRSSATNMLWSKATATAGASSGKYRSAFPAAEIADATWTSGDQTTRAEFRAGMGLAATNLDNPDYNQGFALRKAVTTGRKNSHFSTLLAIFVSHKDVVTAFIGVKHINQLTRENSTRYNLRAKGVTAGKFTIKHISL